MLATRSSSGRPADESNSDPRPNEDAQLERLASEPLGAGLLRLAEEFERRAVTAQARRTVALPPPPSPDARRSGSQWLVGLVVLIALLAAVLSMVMGSNGDGDALADRAETPERAGLDVGEGMSTDLRVSDEPVDARTETVSDGEPGDASGAEPNTDRLRADDEQAGDETGAPEDGTPDGGDAAGDATCGANAFEAVLSGEIDGRPIETIEHRCDGAFGLAMYRAVGEAVDGPDTAPVFVAFVNIEGSWEARHFARSLDCDSIREQAQGFPDSLCQAAS